VNRNSAIAFISPQNKIEQSIYNPFLFEYFFYGKGISEILSTGIITLSGPPVGGLTYSRTVKQGDLDLDVFIILSGGREVFTLYLARRYLYRPVRMVLSDMNGRDIYTAACEYAAMGNGMYFPIRARETMLGLRGNEIDFLLKETEINVPLAEADFLLDIPGDMPVADFRK
jgi:hypothetical protein